MLVIHRPIISKYNLNAPSKSALTSCEVPHISASALMYQEGQKEERRESTFENRPHARVGLLGADGIPYGTGSSLRGAAVKKKDKMKGKMNAH